MNTDFTFGLRYGLAIDRRWFHFSGYTRRLYDQQVRNAHTSISRLDAISGRTVSRYMEDCALSMERVSALRFLLSEGWSLERFRAKAPMQPTEEET